MKCDTNVRVNRPRDEKQVELRNTECRYRKNGVRLSKNSSATLLDPAAGSCSWTLQLDPAAGPCSWILQLDPAAGPCSWILQILQILRLLRPEESFS
ncbi:Hypothetical protein SMAX5B_003186 [Scophthalmus maximus]|uniref:Uncharacterized protein n=1 Tax=Scophthalmus maximus TaxID=52904 RepID=A0A2U9CWS6_SCOMX|nr:Hypothetical protein SMAX5B_003186 [Scophthalmus maximus]